ncbi:uncharacterized protein H6S33_007596 [Morchella sextelata]|uniref:uncharacterized protein n=1 Tax=Morchella sextelata TaxID=1174677 RepID=UPI001D04096E|nr:uncharacterized protein H6S33_007596 [Morchella sextelata]KAH0603274.1 hypothetical protein H6S33_007596 [Morchella sextelata]
MTVLHDSKPSSHLGQFKTTEHLRALFFCPKMDNDMGEYIWSCDTCQSNKSSSHEKYRMLPHLEVPNTPCSSISMDFFVSLPESEAYTRIAFIFGRFTKITYFILLKTEATIKELSHIFLQDIWRLHGLSEVIISDRDFRFESKFWHSLIKLLGVNLCLSKAYRPQADRVTAACTFYANYGFEPDSDWHSRRRKLDNANVSSALLKFKWKALWKTMRTDIFKAQARQKKWYDQKHMNAPEP